MVESDFHFSDIFVSDLPNFEKRLIVFVSNDHEVYTRLNNKLKEENFIFSLIDLDQFTVRFSFMFDGSNQEFVIVWNNIDITEIIQTLEGAFLIAHYDETTDTLAFKEFDPYFFHLLFSS